MTIAYISERDSGVDYHRLIRPFAAIAQLGHEVTRYNAIPPDRVSDVNADVVVFNRLLAPDTITGRQKRGIKVICDVDDYWVLPSTHILYREYKKIGPQIAEAVRLSDIVWATHMELADRCLQLNGNIRIVPNAIAIQDEQWHVAPIPTEKVVGYIAGATHVPDLAVTMGAWRNYTGKRLLVGLTDSNLPQFTAMAAIMSDRGALPIDIAKAADVWNYGTYYDHISIAIAPLANTAFNRCKSNLKILEAGAKGRPIFAQDMPPYVPFDCDGVIHVKDWAKACKQMQTMPMDEVFSRGISLRHYIEHHYSLDHINTLRLDAIG